MKRATKALWLNGLVMPGAGHLTLGCYRRAVLLMVLVVLGLWVVISAAIDTARALIEQSFASGQTVDLQQVMTATQGSTVGWAYLLLLACWIYSMVDGYREGRRQDLEALKRRANPSTRID